MPYIALVSGVKTSYVPSYLPPFHAERLLRPLVPGTAHRKPHRSPPVETHLPQFRLVSTAIPPTHSRLDRAYGKPPTIHSTSVEAGVYLQSVSAFQTFLRRNARDSGGCGRCCCPLDLEAGTSRGRRQQWCVICTVHLLSRLASVSHRLTGERRGGGVGIVDFAAQSFAGSSGSLAWRTLAALDPEEARMGGHGSVARLVFTVGRVEGQGYSVCHCEGSQRLM